MAAFDRRGYFRRDVYRNDHMPQSKQEPEPQWTWPGHVRSTNLLIRVLSILAYLAAGGAVGYAVRTLINN